MGTPAVRNRRRALPAPETGAAPVALPPIRLDDLDRDALLWLVKNRMAFSVSERDLRFAAWESLALKAKAADGETVRLCNAWRDLDDKPLPGSDRVPLGLRKSMRYADREKAWKAYQKASRAAARAHALADAAYQRLDATPPTGHRRPR